MFHMNTISYSPPVETAANLSSQGYNCAQAVLCAHQQMLQIPLNTLKAIACGFGGGMRRGNTCGVVTGALMALGLFSQQIANNEEEGKNLCSYFVNSYLTAFEKDQGHLYCKDLLGYDVLNPKEVEKHQGRKKEICPPLIKNSVLLIHQILSSPYPF